MLLLALLAAYAAMGGFLFGYDLGCINGALPILLNDTSLMLTDSQAEQIVAHCKVGGAAGAIACIWLLRRGHTAAFWIAGLAFVIGPLVMASAQAWEVLAAGRWITGAGVGISAVSSPTYLAEMAPPSSRGCIVGLYEIFLSIGLLSASLINTSLQVAPVHAAIHHWLPQVALWRLMLGIPGLPAVPFFLSCLLLPETPERLVAQGRLEDAYHLLLRLRGYQPPPKATAAAAAAAAAAAHPHVTAPIDRRPNGSNASSSSTQSTNGLLRYTFASSEESFEQLPLTHSGIDGIDGDEGSESDLGGLGEFALPPTDATPMEESAHAEARAALEEIVRVHRQQRVAERRGVGGSAWSRLVGQERRASLLMGVLAVCNQANGSSTLLNYGTELLSTPPFAISAELAGLLSTVAACIKLACVVVSALVVDRCGRRPLLLGGAAATAATLALGAYTCSSASPSTALLLLSLLSFIAAYALSLAPIFFTLLSELFTPTTRPLAAGLATAITFASGGACDMTFLSLRGAVGYPGIFSIYMGVCIMGGAVVFLLLPETKGKSLAQIQATIAGLSSGSAVQLSARLRRDSAAGCTRAAGDQLSVALASAVADSSDGCHGGTATGRGSSREDDEDVGVVRKRSSALIIAV